MSIAPLPNKNKRPDVAIILVGINALDFVRGCLDSIQKAVWRGKTFEVVYVDNGSTDATCEVLAADYPWVKVIEKGHNAGYCVAANEGARLTDSRYLCFLNDDTVVLEDAIALLIEFLDDHPEVGTVGNRLVYPDGSEQYSGHHTIRFPHSRAQFRQVAALVRKIETIPGHTIVMGDFNATPYSRITGAVSEQTGLVRLTGLPSWPSRLELPQVAIDHIFASPELRQTESEQIGNAAGSDHYPVTVKLAVPSAPASP